MTTVGFHWNCEQDSHSAVLYLHHVALATVVRRAQHETLRVRRVDLCKGFELLEGGVVYRYVLHGEFIM